MPDGSVFCSKCGQSVNDAVSPVQQQAVPKKKKGKGCLITIGIVAALIIIIAIAAGSGSDTQTANDAGATQTQNQTQNQTDALPEKANDVPTEYKSALRKAKTYSDMMHMSKMGIYDQLTSEYGEKFTQAEADYAIAHLD